MTYKVLGVLAILAVFVVGHAAMALEAGVQPGSLGDRVWWDKDGQGDQDAGEPGIVGATVELWKDGGLVGTQTTVADGYYLFTGLAAGTYQVTVTSLPAPTDGGTWAQTYDLDGISSANTAARALGSQVMCRWTGDWVPQLDADGNPVLDDLGDPIYVPVPNPAWNPAWTWQPVLDGEGNPTGASFEWDPYGDMISLVIVEDARDVDFGYKTVTNNTNPKVSISGHVYKDCDRDGVLDAGERLLAAAKIALYAGTSATGTPVAVVEPCANGIFAFNDLEPGVYTVVETNQAGYASTNAIGGLGGTKVNKDQILVLADGANGVTAYPNQDFLDAVGCPGIKLVKTGPTSAKAGQTITYTFKVTNTGSLTLAPVKVDDPKLGGVIWQIDSLAAGATVTFTKTYRVPYDYCNSYSSYSRYDGCNSYGDGWNCSGGSYGCGSTCKLVNTATASGYASCYNKVSSTSSCTTYISKSSRYGGSCGSYGGYGGYGGCGSYGGYGGYSGWGGNCWIR